ncbi:hypothetical protein JCM8202_005906 [Rhodotorula sphaerocarpa]
MRQDATFLVAALLLAVARAQPARFPCGLSTPNQQVCDLLSHPTTRRGVLVPIDSECVKAGATGYACGWAGAQYVTPLFLLRWHPFRCDAIARAHFSKMRLEAEYASPVFPADGWGTADLPCTSDLQCDFGSCTGSAGQPGVCVGGLGESCEGSEGPDDSLCAGNLGCQVDAANGGAAVCGGPGADCSFSANYESSSRPNHLACVSGYCHPATLSCAIRPLDAMARVPAEQRPLSRDGPLSAEVADATRNASRRKALPLPNGSACPTGFSACPVARKNSPGDYLFACFDFLSSETHCGGCHDVGAGYFMEHGSPGVDCTTLPGVASSACVDGKCRIMSCSDGHTFDRGSGICVPLRYW